VRVADSSEQQQEATGEDQPTSQGGRRRTRKPVYIYYYNTATWRLPPYTSDYRMRHNTCSCTATATAIRFAGPRRFGLREP
jgi:hypothetical protein